MNDIMNTAAMEIVVNYSHEFYKAKDHDYAGFFNNYVIDEKEVSEIKKEIKKLSDMLSEQATKYTVAMNKRYNVQLVAPEKTPLFMYESRNGNKFYFDSENGMPIIVDPDNMENCAVICLNSKSGDTSIVGGYILELGSVVIRKYKYTIPANNSRINLNLISELLIPIIDKEAHVICCSSDGTITDVGEISNWRYSSWHDTLSKYHGKDFLSKFYGINADSCDINLFEVIKAYRDNASVETLVRQGPPNSMRKLLNIHNNEFKPSIAQYLGLTKPEFKQVIESDILNDYIDFYLTMQELDKKDNENWGKLKALKTIPDWIDYIMKARGWKEDFDFYGINTNRNIFIELLYGYIGEYYGYYYGSNFKKFSEYYSFGDFCSYVIEGCVNQGYTSLKDFVKELEDYLNMATQLGVKPTVNSSYLKQTHDIMARNYKIKIDEIQEEIFASRYQDYKPWISQDKKYTLIAPKNTNDVKLEGSQMNNCVASYIKRILDGTCKIFFFRAVDKSTDSYITVEYRDEAMVQVKRSHNRAPSEKDVEYLKECCEANGWKYKG